MQKTLEFIDGLRRRPKDFRSSYWNSLLLWNPIWVLIICVFIGGFQNLGRRYLTSFLISNFIMHFCFFAVLVSRWVVRHWTKLGSENPLLKSRGWSLSVSFLAMPLGLYLSFKFVSMLGPLFHLQLSELPADADDYRSGMVIGTMIAGLYFVLDTRYEAKEHARLSELKMKELENERLQAQIAALTAQMNPHLLFNALNTVASLVPTDPQKAEEMIVRLSELYRSVLGSSKNMTHPLSKELEICESYLAIEKVRFGERLETEIQMDDTVDAKSQHVPALCLQPLIENAVKHGIAPRANGGRISLFIQRLDQNLQIVIEDNGIGFGKSQDTEGSGSGIKNCRDRLALHFGKEGRFDIKVREAGGTVIVMQMPLVAGRAR